MFRYKCLDGAAIGTALHLMVLVMLGSAARAQTASPSPSPVTAGAPTGGSELQQVTVTGYLIPRAGDGPQPVTVGSNTDAYRASLKEEKRRQIGSEMSDLAHPSHYAQPEPDGWKSKDQK